MRFVSRIYFKGGKYISFLINAKDIDSATIKEDSIIDDFVLKGQFPTCAELDYLITTK